MPDASIAALLTPEAVRERTARLWQAGLDGSLAHFAVHPDRLDAIAERVTEETRRNYADGRVPFHSRWRHFEFGGTDLGAAALAGAGDRRERARAAFDLAIVSVLLDAGAGPDWRYRDDATGIEANRSEGLALASLRIIESGALARATGEVAVDAESLASLDGSHLATLMQSTAEAPLLGVDGRADLLRRLAAVMSAQPDTFTRDGRTRPGHLFDALAEEAGERPLPARRILIALLNTLGGIWPEGLSMAGLALGDVGRHPAAGGDGETAGLVPFHKLSQWLAYSLIEPLEDAGVEVVDLDALTGLAEYRNGGLLLDGGLLSLKDGTATERTHDPQGELVVEWRALTVAALDRIAERVRAQLGADATTLPLASVLQGGTWSAGRRIAAERRPGGPPPLALAATGTLF